MTNTFTESKASLSDNWFEDMVALLRSHQLMLDTDTADPEIRKFYESLFSGNIELLLTQNREMAQQHFVKKMVVEYLTHIKEIHPLRLAIDYNDSEVLIWAEVNDDDSETEKALLIAEAKVNAQYHQYGFYMESTIVEKSDRLSVPNHYHLLKA